MAKTTTPLTPAQQAALIPANGGPTLVGAPVSATGIAGSTNPTITVSSKTLQYVLIGVSVLSCIIGVIIIFKRRKK